MRSPTTWLVMGMILFACSESPQTSREPAPVVDSNLVYHFGYGSNLSGRFMLEHCPNVLYGNRGRLMI